MPANTLGERLRATIIGESHGRLVGVVLDGVPAGLELNENDIQPLLDLRKPGTSPLYSARREPDKVEILSGVYKGRTTGAPVTLVIWNKDVDSRPYEELALIPRPGHADYTAWVKYGGFNDPRGGGRFSGRLTAAMVAGGAVALKLLKATLGVEILAYTIEIGGVKARTPIPIELARKRYESPVRCPDPVASDKMVSEILRARKEGDSLGGIVECVALNVPPGLGDPIVDTLDGDLSKAMFAIPAVKGRHDPCIVPRAVPVVEAMTALVLADHALRAGLIPPVLR